MIARDGEQAQAVGARWISRRSRAEASSQGRSDDHGDPEDLLAELAKAEAETTALRDQLKAILAEALMR